MPYLTATSKPRFFDGITRRPQFSLNLHRLTGYFLASSGIVATSAVVASRVIACSSVDSDSITPPRILSSSYALVPSSASIINVVMVAVTIGASSSVMPDLIRRGSISRITVVAVSTASIAVGIVAGAFSVGSSIVSVRTFNSFAIVVAHAVEINEVVCVRPIAVFGVLVNRVTVRALVRRWTASGLVRRWSVHVPRLTMLRGCHGRWLRRVLQIRSCDGVGVVVLDSVKQSAQLVVDGVGRDVARYVLAKAFLPPFSGLVRRAFVLLLPALLGAVIRSLLLLLNVALLQIGLGLFSQMLDGARLASGGLAFVGQLGGERVASMSALGVPHLRRL